MKIALVSDVVYPFTIGGSEIRNHEVGKRLAEKGHDVHVYGAKLWEGQNTIQKDGMTLHGLVSYGGLSGNPGQRSLFDPVKLATSTFLKLRKERFDVIDTLAFVHLSCYASKLTSFLKKTPLVLTWQQHFGEYLHGFLGRNIGSVVKTLEKGTINLTPYNVAVSETVKQDLMKEGMEGSKIEVIYNGADMRSISLNGVKKEYDLIFVGRLTYQKNPELLVQAIHNTTQEYPQLQACIIGGGEKEAKLKQMTKKLGIEKNVEFKGELKEREEVYSHLRRSKMFVLPSLLEGFPLTMVEANACGIPVVSVTDKWTRVKEFVNGNGLLSEPHPQKLAQSIITLLKDDQKRERMGKIGLKKVKHLDWSNIAEQTESYYESVIQSHKQ